MTTIKFYLIDIFSGNVVTSTNATTRKSATNFFMALGYDVLDDNVVLTLAERENSTSDRVIDSDEDSVGEYIQANEDAYYDTFCQENNI